MNLLVSQAFPAQAAPHYCQPKQGTHHLRIILFFLVAYINPVYAIPPPETLAFVGGSLIYPGLLVFGIISIVFKYIWIRTNLYMLWRLYLPQIFLIMFLAFLFINPSSKPVWIKNTSVTTQTIAYWKKIKSKFIFIDLRDKNSYDKIHLAGSLNFPSGSGLNDYLPKNTDKKIVLYCEYGIKSATLSFLDIDPALLQKTKNENRLFYFPGGIYRLLRLGTQSPAPLIINVPSEYARELVKNAPFNPIEFKSNKEASSPEYQEIIAKHRTPIINNAPSSHDDIAEQLNKEFNAVYSYFTTFDSEKPYPITSFLLVLTILLVIMFFIRRSELLQSVFAKSSSWYQWSNVLISLIMTVPIINFSLQLSIPFDLYLYKTAPDLPLNAAYFISAYAFWTLALGIHLLYPKKKRLICLQQQLNAVFAPNPNRSLRPQLSWKEPLILIVSLHILFVLAIPLSSIFIISVFLLVPIVVDLILYGLTALFKNTDQHALNLLRQCHYLCEPKGAPFILINTKSERSLATIKMTQEKQSLYLGLFTGTIISQEQQSSQEGLSHEDYHFKEATLRSYACMARNLLFLFQQDIELVLDQEHTIVSIKLHRNHLESRVISRHILLKHYQMLPGVTSEQRFTSRPFQEVFAHPTPLLLHIIKQRWSKKGGCIKALHRLGLIIKCNDKTQEQFVAFSNQIYIDTTFEQAIFSSNKLLTWIRKKVVRLRYQLATKSILQDYHTLIVPKTQIRLMKLSDYVQHPLTQKKMQRIVNRALTKLCKESAMWQCYSSLLHQDAFRQLQTEAHNTSCELSTLLQAAPDSPQLAPLPSYYELPIKVKPRTEETHILEQHPLCSSYRDAFLNTECVRTYLRQFQLKEWQLISLLLEQLTQQLEVPISLSYLTLDDLSALPKKRSKLIELLEYRYKTWQLHNQYHFPASFSLQEMETLPLNATEQKERHEPTTLALRVAGNQSMITGTAVVLTENLKIETLAKHRILIADNLSPDQVVACQHIKAIILRKGGYLSHSAIIAREKNIAMIAQFQTATIKDNAKLMIHAGNQVRVLSTQLIDWVFLEELDKNSEAGSKAQRLAIMSQQGFNLPDSIVLKHHSIETIYQLASTSSEHSVWQSYYEELKQLFELVALKQSPIIVRSSTNVEDSAQYSYAGIFYSQANITDVDEFISALCAAWENMMERSTLIKEYSGETQLALNLIVQPYIKGQAGGVLFTESKTPGLMHIEIAAGGVEGVTEGSSTLISLAIDEQGQVLHAAGEKNILSNQQYRDLYNLGRQLETLFGRAQDIEWIIADQQLYVIQSRDINNRSSVF